MCDRRYEHDCAISFFQRDSLNLGFPCTSLCVCQLYYLRNGRTELDESFTQGVKSFEIFKMLSKKMSTTPINTNFNVKDRLMQLECQSFDFIAFHSIGVAPLFRRLSFLAAMIKNCSCQENSGCLHSQEVRRE